MRRGRLAAASFAVTIGLLGAPAAPASAAEVANYGHCVSRGVLDPSDHVEGAWNSRSDYNTSWLQRAGVLANSPGIPLALEQSDGKPGFLSATRCPPAP